MLKVNSGYIETDITKVIFRGGEIKITVFSTLDSSQYNQRNAAVPDTCQEKNALIPKQRGTIYQHISTSPEYSGAHAVQHGINHFSRKLCISLE